jgi:hypothetical protein
VPIDDGYAVHYSALKRGVPVYSADEVKVGKLAGVLDNYRERIMDGLVIELPGGQRRFVDAPEVGRTAERAVTLTISAAEVADLPPPPGAGSLGGRLRRLARRQR